MLILAHRGASGYAPENTVAAFDLARRMGATGIETDVRLSRDGVMVLVHDERVDRTTDGHGRVADLTWEELARLDAGAWLDPKFAGERIVQAVPFLDRYLGATVLPASTLADTQGIVRPTGAPSDAEVVGTSADAEGAGGSSALLTVCLEVKAPEAVEPLVAHLRKRGATERPDLQLTSFNWDAATRLHTLLPRLVVGFLTPRFDDDEIGLVAKAGLSQICPRAAVIEPGLVERARARRLEVRAWGVGTREDFARVVEAGADGMTLNWPDWAHSLAGGPGPGAEERRMA